VVSGAPALAIELAGSTPGTQYDQLHVTGQLSLGGTLQVSLIDSFVPVSGQAFDILDWGSRVGTFASLSLPALSGGLSWNTSQLYTAGILSVGLPGDYNANGTVDGADYVVWRKAGGTPEAYSLWRAHYGEPPSGAASSYANSPLSAVPEPSTVLLLILAAANAPIRRGRASG
jgi:hypothetical protein